MSDIISDIRKSFAVQAENFESLTMNFSKQEYLDYALNAIGVKNTDVVLEVAAGTCATGRTLAKKASKIVCVDATPQMLAVGKKEAIKEGITNIEFIEGLAEKLPVMAESFDIVVTRLSFHHFSEMEQPFKEMNRALKKGGKLVIIDMEATDESMRAIEDEIETMRDFSHVKNRSKEEFVDLYKEYGYELIKMELTPIPVNLMSWMELTKTSQEQKDAIISLMEQDIKGQKATGFFPYMKAENIMFNQRWLFMLGIKN